MISAETIAKRYTLYMRAFAYRPSQCFTSAFLLNLENLYIESHCRNCWI